MLGDAGLGSQSGEVGVGDADSRRTHFAKQIFTSVKCNNTLRHCFLYFSKEPNELNICVPIDCFMLFL